MDLSARWHGRVDVHLHSSPLAGGGGTTDVLFVVDVVSPVAAGLEDIDTAVTVSAAGDTNPANDTDTETTPLDAAPDVAVTIDDAGVTATAGNPIAYTVSVTNVGDQDVGSFSLSQLVPVGTTLDAAGSPGWTCLPDGTAGSTCTFTVASLPVAVARPMWTLWLMWCHRFRQVSRTSTLQ